MTMRDWHFARRHLLKGERFSVRKNGHGNGRRATFRRKKRFELTLTSSHQMPNRFQTGSVHFR